MLYVLSEWNISSLRRLKTLSKDICNRLDLPNHQWNEIVTEEDVTEKLLEKKILRNYKYNCIIINKFVLFKFIIRF